MTKYTQNKKISWNFRYIYIYIYIYQNKISDYIINLDFSDILNVSKYNNIIILR